MEGPAKSPNLNPIESMWCILSRRVYANGRQWNNVAELKSAVLREWINPDLILCYDLVKSMMYKCMEILERGGKKTDY